MLRSLIFVKKHKKTLPWMNPICNSAYFICSIHFYLTMKK